MQIEYKPITDLKPSDYNPRKITDWEMQRLIASLEEFGFVDPVIVNPQNEIIGGHQRVEAAKHIGLEEAPCVTVDVGKEKEKTLNLALNKISGDWDEEKLKQVLQQLDQAEQHLAGFSDQEINEVLKGIEKLEGEEDNYEGEPPKEPKSKYGEIYQLGEHRLMCGDAMKKEDVDRLMNGEKADMVFTSPPYNAGKSAKLSGNTGDNKYFNGYSDDKSQQEWARLIRDSLSALMPYSEYQIYNIQMLSGNKVAFLDLVGEYSRHIADIAIWNKHTSAPAMANNVMNSVFEFLIIFTGQENPTRAIGTANFRGTVDNIFYSPPQRKNDYSDVHAATFPIEFVGKVFSVMTGRSSKIIDPFIGTGSSLITAEELGRVCYGMDIDPSYVDITIDRWEKYTGQKAQKLA